MQHNTRRLSSSTNGIPERPLSAASTDSQDFPDESATKGRWNILRSFIGGAPKQISKSRSPGPPNKDKENNSVIHQKYLSS